MYIGLHVQYPLFLSEFNETWIFSTDLQRLLKYPISSRGSWVVHCRQTDRCTDLMKLILALYYFVHTSKKTLQKDVDCSAVMKYEHRKLISTGKQWDWEILEIDSNNILQLELRYKILKNDHIREWVLPVAHGSQECIVSTAAPYRLEGLRL